MDHAMENPELNLADAPIIEAVVDIDCDLPPALDLQDLRAAAGDALRDRYPKFRQQTIQHVQTGEVEGGLPGLRINQGLGAMQFLKDDGRQLVQFRPNGFSFNRLAPYTSLDDYLPDIEATWGTFRDLAKPIMIRKIGIRMINRIRMPMEDGKLNFGDFLLVPPKLPETGVNLDFLGFLDQHMAIDADTGNRANIVKTTEVPQDGTLPLILDIDVFHPCQTEPGEWTEIRSRIDSIRDLKNRIFRSTLTPRCLNLFSPSA
jgi:uncharacterized protein (TIGR04255 family)